MGKFLLISSLLILASCTQESEDKLFTLLSPNATNINFSNPIKESKDFNVLQYGYLYNGGGVAIGDINNDQLPDIYFSGNLVSNKLYLNQGNFKFRDITEEAGVSADDAWNTGVTMADVNGDGHLDIYVCRSADTRPEARRNLLFINQGDLTFKESARDYGIDDPAYSTQGAFFDYDKDGDLDLYLMNHSTQKYAGFNQITASMKRRQNPNFADKLYRNDEGKFTNVAQEAGIVDNVLGFGLGIGISDINRDGWQDIYISNDYNEQDYLYINNQDGTFSERLEEFIGHVPLFSMGSDIADINNDGYFDIVTLDMLPEDNYRQKLVSGPDNFDKYQRLVQSGFYNQTMRNMLQLNRGGEFFDEIGQFAGISNTDWSWGALLADFDNDGHKDLFISNGYKRDYTNMDFLNFTVQEKLNQQQGKKASAVDEILEKMPSIVVENYAYKNNGDLTFSKMNRDWGFEQVSMSNGAAYADLDDDGDLDLVVNNINESAFVYRNNANTLTDHHYLKVKLSGTKPNQAGIGATVEIFCRGKKYYQEMMPTRGFQSSVNAELTFGLADAESVDTLIITWPDLTVQRLMNVPADQNITLHQKDAQKPTQPDNLPTRLNPLFTENTMENLLDFEHIENDFNDFKREPLLPHMLSTQGPNITKGDINGDGLVDLFIGGAKGSAGALFVQSPSGKFSAVQQDLFETDKQSEDIGALFFDADNDGDLDLYVVSGGSDFPPDSPDLQDRLYINRQGKFQRNEQAIPQMLTSGSCVVAGDQDNDGDLDLFVGGRLAPGQYPIAPRSYLLENDGKGNFKDVTKSWSPALLNPGMVTDALWSDFNQDQLVDLIVVGEWMPIRLFQNNGEKLEEITENAGTGDSEGWWNTILAEDFDRDGDTDYVIGNFGWNSQIQASIAEPASLYAKDFDDNGAIDPIMCYYVQGESYPMFSKDDLQGQINSLKAKYIKYEDYADEKITDIFSQETLKDALLLKAKNLSSSYLENVGNNQFTLSPLPPSTQFSPVYGMVSGDFNEDGNPDLIVAGNFFGTRVKFGRYDANRGICLLGDGSGGFKAMKPFESGLNVRGEVRDVTRLSLNSGADLIIFAKNNSDIQIFRIDNAAASNAEKSLTTTQ
ncbi:VCBS repeat-containing protein [Fulvivirgaceae bacterium BMA12]|uniref:VCBS repeat-containing protein n=1 Tax=Agaribacillus aureus TaxID=3051825 RepID=A0ABT8LKB6_9BACT|nr:VCBS repeat-containing protein [Fulvivirgaceae bacterium BMA12]